MKIVLQKTNKVKNPKAMTQRIKRNHQKTITRLKIPPTLKKLRKLTKLQRKMKMKARKRTIRTKTRQNRMKWRQKKLKKLRMMKIPIKELKTLTEQCTTHE